MAVDQDSKTARKRAIRRASPAVGVSLAVHALLFLAVGLIAPKARLFPTQAEPPVEISLLPPMPRERVHQHAASPAPAKPLAASTARSSLRVHVAPPVGSPAPPTAPNSPTAQPPGEAPGAPKPGTSYAPGPLPAEDGGPRGVRAFLRGTAGCDIEAAHLTREEKDRCAQRFADGARKADPFSGIPPEKLSGFMVEAAANARRRAAHDESVPMTQPMVSCSNPGSGLSGGCLPPEAIHHFKLPQR